MYTEDDTFRHLTRKPFDDVRKLVRLANKVGNLSKPTVRNLLKEMGWTVVEYRNRLAETIRIESNRYPQPRKKS